MKELRTEIEIQPTPEMVWQVLTNLDEYPQSNPFIHRAIGKTQVGEKVDVTFRSGSREMILHCTVTCVEPNRELCWKYHIVAPGLFSGEHVFTIERVEDNRVRFVDRELFHGLLIPMQARDIDTHTKQSFEAMDRALKARAEQK